jgi:UDP-GlcNAc:undecaprenyl-phosphate GlcNAc-1-phosphate transferase
MNILSNSYLIQNIAVIWGIIFFGFILAFLFTPLFGMIAKRVGAVDLPANQRKKNERGIDTRIHAYPYPKLGGLAVALAFFIVLGVSGSLSFIPTGILIGIFIIIVLGIIDDVFEISAPVQFGLQFLAAFAVVASGISITQMIIFGTPISFDWLPEIIIQIGNFTYNFIFPGDLITIFWIVGLINVINWVGGVDGLNAVISSLALGTMLILVISTGNIPLAIVIAAYLGSVLGVLPFNWNPGKIMYGSVGDYLNGYLLAIFAIVGGIKWNATLIVLALPILDGIFVLYSRWKSHPELRKSPLKLMGLSGYNHLHHRILAAGYSKKLVVLIEGTMMFVICTIVLFFSGIDEEYLAIPVVLGLILIIFTTFTFKTKQNKKRNELIRAKQLQEEEAKKDVIVNTIYKDDSDDEKFVY